MPGTTTTPSGLSWTVGLSRDTAPGRLSNLVTWDGGFAAVEAGDDGNGKARPGVWISPDGRSWTLNPLLSVITDNSPEMITETPQVSSPSGT